MPVNGKNVLKNCAKYYDALDTVITNLKPWGL